MYRIAYLPDEARRNEMQVLLERLVKVRNGGAARKLKVRMFSAPKVLLVKFLMQSFFQAKFMPVVIRAHSNPNILNGASLMPEVETLGYEQSCYWCPVSGLVYLFQELDVWISFVASSF